MIPRFSKPWAESLRLVGDGHTLYRDFTLIKDKLGRWHAATKDISSPSGLKVNQLKEPFSVDFRQPYFSWTDNSAERGDYQTAYRIIVGSSMGKIDNNIGDNENKKTYSPKFRRYTLIVLVVLGIQLFYGAFMAGLHAALAANTWPGVNGQFIPTFLFSDSSWLYDISSQRINVQWIHRGLAYILAILLIIWWWKARKTTKLQPLSRYAVVPFILVLVQIVLGILTVLNSTTNIPVTWAVLHQFNGMLLLMAIFIGYFLLTKRTAPSLG